MILETQSLKEYMHGLFANCICSFAPLRFALRSHTLTLKMQDGRETQGDGKVEDYIIFHNFLP